MAVPDPAAWHPALLAALLDNLLCQTRVELVLPEPRTSASGESVRCDLLVYGPWSPERPAPVRWSS